MRSVLDPKYAALVVVEAGSSSQNPGPVETPVNPRIPRWRGFNLTEMTSHLRFGPFREADFEWIAELGFDFVRLPLSYRCWCEREDWQNITERGLAEVDRAVELGRRCGLHVNLNLHRIPGYCVNERGLEPFDLFEGPPEQQARALEAAAFHWGVLAERFCGVSSDDLSFDLLNEPPFMSDTTRYTTIVRELIATIRDRDPGRLIVADGADLGQTPVPSLVDLGVVQSTRGYLPKALSHYRATWVLEAEFESFALPAWPLRDASGLLWDAETLRRKLIEPWRVVTDRGVPVHVGEWGCFNQTPHEVALAWMRDLLSLWRSEGWGWSLWNFRGAFGILDSQRRDVAYEPFRGHQLDRKMLELLLTG